MLKIKNISKSFGKFKAVENLTLNIGKGELFGFLGPNGAGKTTTIKMLAGLLSADSGEITIDDIDISKDPIKIKKILGYVPDQPFLYDKLTGKEFLYFTGGLFDISKEKLRNKIEQIIEMFKIGDWIDKKSEDYSQGMRQRISFASSFLNDPKILIIDEPMVGLDPQSAFIMKNILINESEKGTTIFMSTHSLHIAEEICSRVGIINKGKIIYDDSRENLRQIKKTNNKDLENLFLELTN
jgi:ABC-2 type transport system ATP-binding protein